MEYACRSMGYERSDHKLCQRQHQEAWSRSGMVALTFLSIW